MLANEIVAINLASLAVSCGKFKQFPTVELVEEIDSTNSELIRRINSGLNENLVLVAKNQTSGRGRRNRQWLSKINESICFSYAKQQENLSASGLSLVVGLTIAETLNHLYKSKSFLLKWPNDILIVKNQELCGKVAGVLIERIKQKQQNFFNDNGYNQAKNITWDVVGIGINYLFSNDFKLINKHNFPSLIPCGLDLLANKSISREDIIANITNNLRENLNLFSINGLTQFLPSWNELHYYNNQQVQVSDDDRELYHGVCRGIDQIGNLLIEEQNGNIIIVNVGDLSLRKASN